MGRSGSVGVEGRFRGAGSLPFSGCGEPSGQGRHARGRLGLSFSPAGPAPRPPGHPDSRPPAQKALPPLVSFPVARIVWPGPLIKPGHYVQTTALNIKVGESVWCSVPSVCSVKRILPSTLKISTLPLEVTGSLIGLSQLQKVLFGVGESA